MPKRFTDSQKFQDRWYRSLTPGQKCAWEYLTSNCDAAGVIDLDEELANFQIGEEINWSELVNLSDGRIVRLDGGQLFLPKFIEFQYGEISEDCRAHNPIFKSIQKYRLDFKRQSVPKGYGYPPGKGKGKRQGQEKKVKTSRFDDFWNEYPLKNGKQPARGRYDQQIARLLNAGTPSVEDAESVIIAGAVAYSRYLKQHPDPPKIKYPSGWLNEQRYENDYEQMLRAELGRSGGQAGHTFDPENNNGDF